MRNTHLALGIGFSLVAALFAVSSLIIVYRPLLPRSAQTAERTVSISAGAAGTPRALAMHLMRKHGLRGDLLRITETGATIAFNINRPGIHSHVEYSRDTGEALIETRRYNLYEKLVQLHVNHGFWHSFIPSTVWAALSFLFSIALLLLGATGIYLWFRYRRERRIGTALLGFSLAFGFITLFLARMS